MQDFITEPVVITNTTSIAICIMIKDDHSYIEEWLRHHRDLGVDHFYFYDNESTPPYKDLGDDVTITYWDENQYFKVILPIVNEDLYDATFLSTIKLQELRTTHWVSYPERDTKQFKAYQHCVNNHGHKHKWIAFIDSDEFINVAEGLNIPSVLKAYEDDNTIGQVLMKWRMFSSSGHQTKQPLQKEAYTDWFPDYQVKSFLQPAKLYAVSNIHVFSLYHMYSTITEDPANPLVNENLYTEHSSDIIWVNHYWSRSREDFEETKIKRKGGTTLRYDEHYEAKYQFIEKRASFHMKELAAEKANKL
jgi:hypothetical protein